MYGNLHSEECELRLLQHRDHEPHFDESRMERADTDQQRLQVTRRCLEVRSEGYGSIFARSLYNRSVDRSSPNAPVAQWIEHRPSKPRVAGSSPAGRAIRRRSR